MFGLVPTPALAIMCTPTPAIDLALSPVSVLRLPGSCPSRVCVALAWSVSVLMLRLVAVCCSEVFLLGLLQ